MSGRYVSLKNVSTSDFSASVNLPVIVALPFAASIVTSVISSTNAPSWSAVISIT